MKKLGFLFIAVALVSMTVMTSCVGSTEEEANAQAEELLEGLNDALDEIAEEPIEVVEEVVELNLTKGKEVYEKTCQVCHQANGEGLAGTFPPLAKSDYLNDKAKSIQSILNGLTGEITVNDVVYNTPMAANNISDEETVDVMNYIFNSWGNDLGTVTIGDVTAAK